MSVNISRGNVEQIHARCVQLHTLDVLKETLTLLQSSSELLLNHPTLEEAQEWEREHMGGSHRLWRTIGPATASFSVAKMTARRWDLQRDLQTLIDKFEEDL
jgi:hypothetical protein